MTKTTEELKREMYQWLRLIKGSLTNNGWSDGARKGEQFEEVLEAYLEALRQEIQDLTITRGSIREERDAYMAKLQAFEFANKSAGEFLQESRAKCKRLKSKFQEARKELSELLKSVGGTSGQDSEEVVSESILGPIQRICQHSFRVHHAYPSGKLQSQCIFCLKIED